ncbi:MAG: hypothetical protein ACRCSG_05585 [Cellulosilyticaceae bacterium]
MAQLKARLQQQIQQSKEQYLAFLPSDFPQDLFNRSSYKLMLLKPVYKTYLATKYVKSWQAELQLQAPALKEVRILGVKVPFSATYPVQDATLTMQFSTGRVSSLSMNFLPLRTNQKKVVPLQVAAAHLAELTADRFPFLALVLRREGDWVRLGERVDIPYVFRLAAQNRIIPLENIMQNYSDVWMDMQKVIPYIPICKIIWDTYNFSAIYSDYRVSKIPTTVKKSEWVTKHKVPYINKEGKEDFHTVTVEEEKEVVMLIENTIIARDIYFNIQEYKKPNEPARGNTVTDIMSDNGFKVEKIDENSDFSREILDVNYVEYSELEKASSFDGFDITNSLGRVVSLVTMKAKQTRLNEDFNDYSNNNYKTNSVKPTLLIQFMKTFFHELIAHIWGSTGVSGGEQDTEHSNVGWNGNTAQPISGGCNELLWNQIIDVIKEEPTQEVAGIYEIDIHSKKMTAKDWQAAIDKLVGVMKDPYISKTDYAKALISIYNKELIQK